MQLNLKVSYLFVGFHVEKCKDSEGDGAKDANFAKYYVVNNVKDDVPNKKDGKFDRIQGISNALKGIL